MYKLPMCTLYNMWCNIWHCGVLIPIQLWWSTLPAVSCYNQSVWYAHFVFYSVAMYLLRLTIYIASYYVHKTLSSTQLSILLDHTLISVLVVTILYLATPYFTSCFSYINKKQLLYLLIKVHNPILLSFVSCRQILRTYISSQWPLSIVD